MKKMHYILILFLCGIFLTGCTGRESGEENWKGIQSGMADLTAITERTEYYDIISESEDIFHLGLGNADLKIAQMHSGDVPLGTQFYQQELIQLWGRSSDIYLYRTDGSSEILLQDVPADYTHFTVVPGWRWYLSKEGDFYCWHAANYSINSSLPIKNKIEATFAKISAFGEIIYEKTLDPGVFVEDFCQLSDGRCYLLLQDKTEQTRTLAELDTAAESFTVTERVQMKDPVLWSQSLGEAGGALAVLNHEPRSGWEIVELNPADGTESSLLSFTGTSYPMKKSGMTMHDFRVLEDGSVEVLWLDSMSRAEGTLERLRMAKVEKTPIVMRGNFMSDSWIIEMVSGFNRQSAEYHVVIEDCGAGNDTADFARLTSIQLAAGKGPDIIQTGFMKDYITGMLEKGIMEDLKPYMEAGASTEKSGIREEDYFPFVFDTWRDGGHIYGINPRMDMTGYRMERSVLGSREEPDIETLVDSLLSWEENAVFLSKMSSQELLKFFLEGTDTIWGMVDWEKGSCDFSGELFAKMLEAAGRYGWDERKSQFPSIAEERVFYDIFMFDSAAEQEDAGKVTCGILFDDGCHVAQDSTRTMAVNSNSSHKEGAWEFLCFLLGDEAQPSDGNSLPVSRRNFEIWLERQKERVQGGKKTSMIMTSIMPNNEITTSVVTYTEENLTEEKIEEYRKALEEARSCPIRTAPILDIILEESADYFNGNKSAAEVGRVVANRVKIYLDEGR